MAERRRELQVDERLDPFRARGDVATGSRPTASSSCRSTRPATARRGREARCGHALEIPRRSSSTINEPCSAASVSNRCATGAASVAGRVVQRRVGDVQARPMLGDALQRAQIGAVRRVRDADDPRTVRAATLEVGIATTPGSAAAGDEIERVRAAVGQHDLRGFSLDAVLRAARRAVGASRAGRAVSHSRSAHRLRRATRRAARGTSSHRAADGGSHPQPGFTDVGAASATGATALADRGAIELRAEIASAAAACPH